MATNTSLEKLLADLEAQKSQGGIDNETYNYVKNQYLTQDQNYIKERDKNYNEYVTANPFDTQYAKDILSQYKLNGEVEARNQIASGAGDNGGNIDSFAAANANRQQLAFTNEGSKLALSAYETRQDRILNYLNMMKADVEGYYAKTDKLATDNLNFKTNIGNQITNVYGQINANNQAEKDRQNALAQIATQQQYAMQQQQKEYEYQNALLEKQQQYELAQAQKAATNSNSSSSGATTGVTTSTIVDMKEAAASPNVASFNSSIKTSREFSSRGKTDSGIKFDNYNQYLTYVMSKWYEDGKLTENEVAYLKGKYRLQ